MLNLKLLIWLRFIGLKPALPMHWLAVFVADGDCLFRKPDLFAA
jgi:hypothetical protein